MEAISFIALILLCLVGYASGAVTKAGRSVELRPRIIDLILIFVIWAGAVYFRIALDLNKWLVILIWIIISGLIAVMAVWPRKLTEEQAPSDNVLKKTASNPLKGLWQSWGDFSKRMGGFQSRMVLSLFFFIVVPPFALAVKIFSDPLRIKYRVNESHWQASEKTVMSQEQFRRQF